MRADKLLNNANAELAMLREHDDLPEWCRSRVDEMQDELQLLKYAVQAENGAVARGNE